MRILVMGNSGSGKSTLAQQLAQTHQLDHLDLDTIVWEPNQVAILRQSDDIQAALMDFINHSSNWVIEGCYGELIESALPYCTELIFLNPGVEACLSNNQQRPWEAHKYASKAEQDEKFAFLQAWVRDYYTRTDQWSLAYHQRIFNAFPGKKCEVTTNGMEMECG